MSFTKRKTALTSSVILALSTGYAFASGPGHAVDWATFRLWTLGLPYQMGVWNPYWTRLLLLPLAGLPQDIGHVGLNLATYSALFFASGQVWSFLTFAVNNQAWVGNLEGFMMWGMILARRRNPYVVGAGLFLMSIKPQFAPLAAYYIWQRRDHRILFMPLFLVSLSFLLYGNWLPRWVAILPPTPQGNINVSWFPWTLPLWLLLPFARDKERFVLAATAVSVPYFNQVSLATLFAFPYRWWAAVPLIILTWLDPRLLAPACLLYALLVRQAPAAASPPAPPRPPAEPPTR